MKRRRRRWFWIGAPFVSLLWMGVGIVLAIGLAQCLGSASPKNAFSPFAVAFHGLFILASFLIAARCCGLAKVTRRSVRVYCLGKRSEILWENARSAGVCCVQTCFRFARRWNIAEKLFFISMQANALPVLESINWWTVGAFCVRRCNGETLLVVSAPNALLNAARRHGRSRGLPWSRLRIDIGDASESPR